METITLLDEYIKKRTKNLGPYPDIIENGINTISGEVPFKLKLAITLSELITFSSHLRKPIELYDGTLVPTNAIVFALSASGTSKDKSLNALRKSLTSGYEHLESQRKEYAQKNAEKKAILEGDSKEDWQKYYISPKPLQAGLGTVEGLMHHFADISQNPMGAGSILSSEIGSELQTNGSIVDIIKIIAVAYDLGNVPPKIVKSAENQTGAVKGLPVNALFFGAQEGILFNNDIKNKFRLVFNTQLARRSIFSFTPEAPQKLIIKSIDELYVQKEAERKRVLSAQIKLNALTADLVEDTTRTPLTITPDANKLFDVYLEYNSIISDDQSGKYPISKLSRKHKQWLALKLAGTYAILSNQSEITETTYAYAINTVEFMSPDMTEFEKELVKEPYEQLTDMCKYNSENGEFFVSLHELRKLSYITGNGSSKSKVDEMTTLANSYDEYGSYQVHEGGIQYKELIKTDVIGVSFKVFDLGFTDGKDIKEYMSRNSSDGYSHDEYVFEDIGELLEMNACYSSFEFADGIRKKENLIGGTKFVILDIDKSMLTDFEAHTLLSEYNHFVVRTSDPENNMKFRVILELDSMIDIDERMWKAFIEELADELGLVIDVLPQSQIFLSFAGRNILKQTEGITIKTKYLLENAAIRMKDKPKPAASLPAKEKDLKLDDPRETFGYAFEADKGERSVKIYRALAHAIDLGADETYIVNLAEEINSYYVEPMDADRLDRTLVTPALRRL
jgi:hypothetical protein